jgi:hypothetical protein
MIGSSKAVGLPAPTGLTYEGAPIVAIVYQRAGRRWLPCHVLTEGGDWSFDWCAKSKELAFHDCGSGPRGSYSFSRFANAPKICAKLWLDRDRLKPLTGDKTSATSADLRAMGYQLIKQPLLIEGHTNPFEFEFAVEAEGNPEFCIVCDSYYRDDYTCCHLWQSDNGWLGCGASELEFRATQASLYRLLNLLPPKTVREIKEAALSGKWHSSYMDSMLGGNMELYIKPTYTRIWLQPLRDELDYEERYWPGVAWLLSLDTQAKEALALTAGWLHQWERESWNGSCVLDKCSLIRRLSDKELDEWLALDPHDASVLRDRPLKVRIPFKVASANDHQFLKNPAGTAEVLLWPKHQDGRALRLSVARVRQTGKREISLWLGRVLARNGQHVSTLPGYRFTY